MQLFSMETTGMDTYPTGKHLYFSWTETVLLSVNITFLKIIHYKTQIKLFKVFKFFFFSFLLTNSIEIIV